MRSVRAVLLLACVACSRPHVEPPRPVQPQQPTAQPCSLPPLPDGVTWGGVPQYDTDGNFTGWYLITQDGIGGLDRNLAALVQWAESAQGCLASGH